MSEEKKAVDEAIRSERLEDAMDEAFIDTCETPLMCAGTDKMLWCIWCGWNAEKVRSKIEQVIDESS